MNDIKKIKKLMRKFRIATLRNNFYKATENKEKWQEGDPEEKRPLCFQVGKIWHNGFYENGFFRIVGDKTKTEYKAEKWFYL